MSENQELHDEMLQTLRFIALLSSGWDAHGSLGPVPPLSWETVARMSLDLARSMVLKIEARQDRAGASA